MPVTALCKELDEKASQWVQILPSGPDIKGLDGRSWVLRNPMTSLFHYCALSIEDVSLENPYPNDNERSFPKKVRFLRVEIKSIAFLLLDIAKRITSVVPSTLGPNRC